eukprot:3039339-Prymnesium_polylepis.1
MQGSVCDRVGLASPLSCRVPRPGLGLLSVWSRVCHAPNHAHVGGFVRSFALRTFWSFMACRRPMAV